MLYALLNFNASGRKIGRAAITFSKSLCFGNLVWLGVRLHSHWH